MSSGRLGLAAAACGLIAAWLVFAYTGRSGGGAGPVRPVLVASVPLQRGEPIAASIERRSVPERFAPPDAAAESDLDRAGAVIADLPAGTVVTRSLLKPAGAVAGTRLRRGERALTIDAAVSPSAAELTAGDRVDIYASGFGGDQTSTLLIAAAEVLESGEAAAGRASLTLRLASAQVAAAIRADVFAHDLRAVALPGAA